MSELLEKVNKRHQELDEKLDRKLELIDECLESGRECPCGNEECGIDIEEFKELDAIYESVLKEVILKKVPEEKVKDAI